MWAVYEEEFCLRSGASRDLVYRLVEAKKLDVLYLPRAHKKGRWMYIVANYKAKRLCEYGGRRIRTKWHTQKETKKREMTFDGLCMWGANIASVDEKGREVFSADEVAAFLNVSVWKIRRYCAIGLLNSFIRTGNVGRSNLATKRKYVVADEYLEILFKLTGAVCTGMTFKKAKEIMVQISMVSDAMKDEAFEKVMKARFHKNLVVIKHRHNSAKKEAYDKILNDCAIRLSDSQIPN